MSLSPNITVKKPEPKVQIKMDFPNAIRLLTDGKKITRLSWSPNDSYGLLKDGLLMLWIDGQFKRWIVNDGDLTGEDWIVLEELNEIKA